MPTAWERDKIISIPLPAPMRYGPYPVKSIRIHHKLVGPFHDAFSDIYRAALWHVVESYGGGYNFRLIRGGGNLSMHAFGAAIDIDPEHNPLGASPNECSLGSTPAGTAVVRLFEKNGFSWGGKFSGRKDCQHFQYGSGL